MSRARRVAVGVATALAVTIPIAALTVFAASPATDQLRAAIDQVVRILDDPELKRRGPERRHAIRRVAGEIFDFQEITKRALGQHWHPRTAVEREEIVRLFRDLLERSYVSKIELYSGERIVYVGESTDGDHATVRTRIVTKQGTEIPVDYRMARRGARWSAYDVSIEGVSLVANYRGQFNRIMQSGSYAELVKRLRAKLEEADEGPKVAPTSRTQ